MDKKRILNILIAIEFLLLFVIAIPIFSITVKEISGLMMPVIWMIICILSIKK